MHVCVHISVFVCVCVPQCLRASAPSPAFSFYLTAGTWGLQMHIQLQAPVQTLMWHVFYLLYISSAPWKLFSSSLQ